MRDLGLYKVRITVYGERHLFKTQDILAAFRGVSNIVRGRMPSAFHSRLTKFPLRLGFALLWKEPTRAVERRVITGRRHGRRGPGQVPRRRRRGATENGMGRCAKDVCRHELVHRHPYPRLRTSRRRNAISGCIMSPKERKERESKRHSLLCLAD